MTLPLHLQDQLAAAQAAVAEAGVKLGEEQEARRDFLRQFQAKSKAALAERVELEHQVCSFDRRGASSVGWVWAFEDHMSAPGDATAQRAASTHSAGDELLLHVSPNHRVDDSHKTNYYGSEARGMPLLLLLLLLPFVAPAPLLMCWVLAPQLEAANGQLDAARAQQVEADSLHSQLQTAQVNMCSLSSTHLRHCCGRICQAPAAPGGAGNHSCGNGQAGRSAAACRGGARGCTW